MRFLRRTTVALFMALAAQGAAAQVVTSIQVVQKTADVGYAATDDSFRLVIKASSLCTVNFPNLPSDERERGRTDTYNLNIASCNLDRSVVTPSNVFIRTLGHNAWLPASFKMVGTLAGGGTYTIVDRTWPNLNWFSTDLNDWPAPKVVRSEWSMAAGGSSAGPSAASVTVTVRHWTYSTSTWPTCTGNVTVAGTLLSAASGATTGSGSFSHVSSWSGNANSYSGDQYYCDAAWVATNLKAGSWRLSYQVTGGSGSNCTVTLPLSSSAAGRVNFTNGRGGCTTGWTFP